jgi:hypothetical protein
MSARKAASLCSVDAQAARAKRFHLQNVARGLLPAHRVSTCLRVAHGREGDGGVHIWHAPELGRAHFSGLVTCGCVYACPVCAAKVAERRRGELVRAMQAHEAAGGRCYFLTQTMRHGKRDDFGSLKAAFQSARRMAAAGRRPAAMRDNFGVLGMATAIEATYGAAGWHLHSHSIVFASAGANVSEWQSEWRELWAAAVWKAQGRTVGESHGLRLEIARSGAAGKYIAKLGSAWNAADELARVSAKTARRNGRTLLALLQDAGGGDVNAGRLWIEAVHGLRGVPSLRWTAQLKSRLLPSEAELSDADLLSLVETPARLLAVCPVSTWRVICQNELRSALLAVADTGSEEAVKDFIAAISAASPRPVSPPKATLIHRPRLDSDGLSGAAFGLSGREFRAWRAGGQDALMKLCRPRL